MKLKLWSLILFCSFSILSKAQTGTVIFNVAPLQAIIKIDNQLLKPAEIGQPKTSLELAAGTYEVQIWSFGMVLHKQNINVVANDTTMVGVALKPTEAYQVYKKELGIYDVERAKVVGKQLPVMITAGITTAATLSYATARILKLNELEGALESYKTNYENNFDSEALRNNRNSYEKTQEEFNEKRQSYHLFTTIGGTVSLGLWSYSFYKIKKGMSGVKKPIFNDTNPLSNVRLDLKNERVALGNDIPAFSIYYQF